MKAPRRFDVLLVAAAVTAAGVLVLLDGAGPAEWLFGTFLLVCAGYVVRAGVAATARARVERVRAARLAGTEPGTAARAAILEERRRLEHDIAGVLRESLSHVLREASAIGDDDPRPAMRRVHEHARLATSELRRHLGLLRAPDLGRMDITPSRPAAPRAPRRDLAVAALLAGLAAAEVAAYLRSEGPAEWLPWSPVLSALAAVTFAGRTVAPGVAATLCAGVIVVGSWIGYPVTGGFWVFGTLGGLLWAIAARARVPSLDSVAGLLLVVAVAWTRRADDPDNLLVFLLLMAVALAGGLVVRLAGVREASSRATSRTLEARLHLARRAAVEAERAAFARELHDVVSHAVGLVAMQAGAAAVSWPHDRGGVRRSVDVIEATAAATLAELDRLVPGAETMARDVRELPALVRRIRAAGTPVDLTVVGEPTPAAGAVVYRVVQESLTNVLRHAPGASARVELRTDDRRTTVRVVDDGPTPESSPGRGYGLVGLAERVALAGGTLATGRGGDGTGFEVRAVLPVASEVATGATPCGVPWGVTAGDEGGPP